MNFCSRWKGELQMFLLILDRLLSCTRSYSTGTRVFWFQFWIIPELPRPFRWTRVTEVLGTTMGIAEMLFQDYLLKLAAIIFDLAYCLSSYLIGSVNLGYQLVWKLIASSVAKRSEFNENLITQLQLFHSRLLDRRLVVANSELRTISQR